MKRYAISVCEQTYKSLDTLIKKHEATSSCSSLSSNSFVFKQELQKVIKKLKARYQKLEALKNKLSAFTNGR